MGEREIKKQAIQQAAPQLETQIELADKDKIRNYATWSRNSGVTLNGYNQLPLAKKMLTQPPPKDVQLSDSEPFGQGFMDSITFGLLDKVNKTPYGEINKLLNPEKIQAGNVAGDVVTTIGTYQIAGMLAAKIPALANVSGKVAKTLGLGAKGTEFLNTQMLDLVVDNIAQSPRNVIEFIQEDKTIAQGAKDLAMQNVLDIGLNAGIYGIGDMIKNITGKTLKATVKPKTNAEAYAKMMNSNIPVGQKEAIVNSMRIKKL